MGYLLMRFLSPNADSIVMTESEALVTKSMTSNWDEIISGEKFKFLWTYAYIGHFIFSAIVMNVNENLELQIFWKLANSMCIIGCNVKSVEKILVQTAQSKCNQRKLKMHDFSVHILSVEV